MYGANIRLQFISRPGLSTPQTRGSRSQNRGGGKAKPDAGYRTAIAQLVSRTLCFLKLRNFRASVIIPLQNIRPPSFAGAGMRVSLIRVTNVALQKQYYIF
jgi:hypothetical protein